MNKSESNFDPDRIREIVAGESDVERLGLAERLASDFGSSWEIPDPALEDSLVRRWCRGVLMDWLSDDDAEKLAERLLEWFEDFHPERRDRTTSDVVNRLSESVFQERYVDLAGTNAASEVWDRFVLANPGELVGAARQVLMSGDRIARETTLHLLVLDPYGPEYLNRDQQNDLLILALDDSDEEIRGLAAEVVAVDLPDTLLDRRQQAQVDGSERVRMAFWRTAFVHQPEWASMNAGAMVLETTQPLHARRTALLAFGEHVPTRDASPVLEAILAGNEEVLAEDAADLMWRYHRAPAIANAAASSPFEHVRDLAERLLHPERGSPAAGGSRPGDPTKTTDFYDEILSEGDKSRRESDDR